MGFRVSLGECKHYFGSFSMRMAVVSDTRRFRFGSSWIPWVLDTSRFNTDTALIPTKVLLKHTLKIASCTRSPVRDL